MVPQWIIEKKREGKELSAEEISAFIDGYTSGSIPDYQMSAMAMAIYFQGMSPVETAALTRSMLDSGTRLATDKFKAPKIDKHSTGGIGDKVSLILAPLLACANTVVPMISGRGLGITGGTLDKLESIPGFRANLSERELLDVLDACGCVITGQTADIAPADGKLYALRDVTGTVNSIPLITASILCKKLAEGLDALVLDVKTGAGALMQTMSEAEALAQSLVSVGAELGLKAKAFITDMNQPLGNTVGNSLEVQEAVATLRGSGPGDLKELCVVLAAELLVMSHCIDTETEAKERCLHFLESGQAYERFCRMVSLQGGDCSWLEVGGQARGSCHREYVAEHAGYIAEVNADKIGRAALQLGAGRRKMGDSIDYAAGLSCLRKNGERAERGDVLCVLHAASDERIQEVYEAIGEAFTIQDAAPDSRPLIYKTIP